MTSPARSLPIALVTSLAAIVGLIVGLVVWLNQDAPRGDVEAPVGEAPAEDAPVRGMLPVAESLLDADADDSDAAVTRRVRTIVGRVESRPEGTPMAGILVALDDEETRAQARSDEDGGFVGRWNGSDEAFAVATPKRGWVPAGPPVALTAEHLAGTEELVLRLKRGTSAVGYGQVVDPTGAPVFEVEVRVRQPATKLLASAVTDDGGRFRTEATFPSGSLSVSVLDHPPGGEPVGIASERADHLEGGKVRGLLIEAQLGPTFWLGASSGPQPDATFVVQVRPVSRSPFAGVLQLDRGRGTTTTFTLVPPERVDANGEVDDSIPESEGDAWRSVPVRDKGLDGAPLPPYARYPKGSKPEPGWAYRLAMWNNEWTGSADLLAIEGLHPELVAPELGPVARIMGRVEDTRGAAVAKARVQLHAIGERNEAPRFRARTDRRGAFAFAPVPTGSWDLVVIPKEHAGEERTLSFGPGALALDPIVLPAIREHGSIEGELSIPTELRPSRLRVTAASAEGADFFREDWLIPDSVHGAETVFRFQIDDVPSSNHTLTVGGLGVESAVIGTSWSPPRHTVLAPRTGVRFSYAGAEGVREIRFAALSSSGRIPSAEAVFGHGSWMRGMTNLWKPSFLYVPRDAPLRFEIRAAGFQPFWGTEADVTSSRDGDTVEVVLDPGWGATLYTVALDAENLEGAGMARLDAGWNANPVVGVRALADGVLAGTSDARGRLRMVTLSKPSTITLEAPGWRVTEIVTGRGRRESRPYQAGPAVLFERVTD